MARVQLGVVGNRKFFYELNSLTRHAAILGTTGSGKTVMGKAIIEEAMMRGIPVIAIDPKGDMGGLAVSNRKFDFRPFSGGQSNAEKVASKYYHSLKAHGVDFSSAGNLSRVKTRIFTPKSNVGLQVSLMPDLKAVPNFAQIESNNPTIVADLVEPISESIAQLAGLTGAKREKAQSLISSILVHNWKNGKDVSFDSLVKEIISPPFETIGSLPLNDFLKENDRKGIAASVNLLLSSPAKSAWRHGEKLDVAKMLSPNSLSIFDLRFTGSNEDKQYVVEQILSSLYLYLIKKGGSEKLRYILYIDELAGLLPMPPASPPCKKLLELLVRQARAFGLGVIMSTQSPGDIDYRIFGNVGTRLIGKLRTEIEIEKVATAMNVSSSILKEQVGMLSTGDFVYNDAVKNVNKLIHGRWLFTYHAGPLKPKEIAWVNSPESSPKASGEIKIAPAKKKKAERESSRVIISRAVRSKAGSKAVKKIYAPISAGYSLNAIINRIRRFSDKVQVKITFAESQVYVPHLKIVVEPKKLGALELPLQGPYVFDLTTKIIPLGNYLQNVPFRTFMPSDVKIVRPKASIEKTIDYAVKDALSSLRRKYYSSSLSSITSFDRKAVEKRNHVILSENAKSRVSVIELKANSEIHMLKTKADRLAKIKTGHSLTLHSDRVKRVMTKLFTSRKVQARTAEHEQHSARIKALDRQIKLLYQRIGTIKKRADEEKRLIEHRTRTKAREAVKEDLVRLTRSGVIVHATLLLLPKRKTEV